MRGIVRLICTLALGIAPLIAVSHARADEPGQDEVTLRSGGSIRGTVLVSEPGESVKIAVMGEAQPRVVPWAEVDHVDKGKYGPSVASLPRALAVPPAPPAALARSSPAPRLGDPGVVKVHVDSPVSVTLVHEYVSTYPVTESRVDRYGYIVSRGATGVSTQPLPLCSSPCDQVVHDAPLRIVGFGMPSSSTFDFAHDAGDVTVRVRPGNNRAYRGGITAIVLGSVATIVGATIIPINQASSTTTDANTGAKVHIPNPALRDTGVGLISGGLLVLGGGITLLVIGETKVTITPGTGAAHAEAKPRYWLGEF